MHELSNFVIAIEANEIAVIEFDCLRKYIQRKTNDVSEVIRVSRDVLNDVTLNPLKLSLDNGWIKQCDDINEKLMDIIGYLFDYRIELMNSFLSDIFENEVPRRKPSDPQCKTLLEVAEKEDSLKSLLDK